MSAERPHSNTRLLCQLSLLLPLVSLPLSWIGALLSLGHAPQPPSAGARWSWRRRIWVLAVVDLLLVALATLWLGNYGAAMLRGGGQRVSPGAHGGRRAVIGLRFDHQGPGPGARVLVVWPETPAARAGLRAGDRVAAVDGEPLRAADELSRIIASTPRGASRRLRVRRGQTLLALRVTPVSSDRLRWRKPHFFESPPGQQRCGGDALGAPGLWGWAPMGALALVLMGLGLWRRLGSAVQIVAAALLPAGSMLLALGAGFVLCRLLRGPSLGSVTVGMLSGELVLLGGAWLLLRRLAVPLARDQVEGARIDAMRAVAWGLGYMMGGALRLSVVVGALSSIWGSSPQGGSSAIALDVQSVELGAVGLALLGGTAVLVGPLAEEVYFRGLLLPWLRRGLGAGRALWITALLFGLLHVHYGLATPVTVLYGYVLGWARLRSGGLAASLVLHGIINLTAGAVMLAGQ